MSFLKTGMNIPRTCSQCRQEGSHYVSLEEVELRNDGRYELTCPRGHKTVTILQINRYELLFDLGAYAILDGYYREAVNSFAASLERFYEFFIKAALLDNKSGKDFEVFSKLWKKVGNNSERQLGAFIMLHSKEFGEPPSLLNRRNIEFRNDVVHKGRFPTYEESIAYGQSVMDVIRPILKRLKEKWPDGKIKAILHDINSSRQPQDGDQQVSTLYIPTILSSTIAEPAHNERSLDESLARLKTHRVLIKDLKAPKHK